MQFVLDCCVIFTKNVKMNKACGATNFVSIAVVELWIKTTTLLFFEQKKILIFFLKIRYLS
jgi:hypothetical protein